MSLNDTICKTSKPKDKPYKLSDEKGMFLSIRPNGSKYWQMKYRFAGREKLLSLGTYPEVKLGEARDQRDEARKLLREDIDPSTIRRENRLALATASENTFEAIAREWHTKNLHTWAEEYGQTILNRLEANIFPWIGKTPIKDVNPQQLLSALRRVEGKGHRETAHRILQKCSCIFRYAIATLRADRDPAADLKGAIPPPEKGHLAAITNPKEIKILLQNIDGYHGDVITRCALKLAALVFVRPNELRHAEWVEMDFKHKEWRIPAEKMKMPYPHIVPLSTQASKILKDIQPLTGKLKYIFPGIRSKQRPMSENTVLAALRRLGYTTDEMTGHGFRSMASTILNEQGWNPDAIERQLAHRERNKVRAAYNYAQYLEERHEMMQAWADYLDRLTSGETEGYK